MKKYYVEVNGNEYEVIIKEAAENEEKIDKSFNKSGNVKRPQPEEDHIENGNIKLSSNQVPVLSPMSGKVLSIKVTEEEDVKKGQVLLSIEAMKMETEIVAPVAGTISTILVGEGQNCKRQDKLAVINEAGDN